MTFERFYGPQLPYWEHGRTWYDGPEVPLWDCFRIGYMAPILRLIWSVRSCIVLLGTDLRRILVTGYMRMAYEDHIDSDANLNSHPTLKVQLANYMVFLLYMSVCIHAHIRPCV